MDLLVGVADLLLLLLSQVLFIQVTAGNSSTSSLEENQSNPTGFSWDDNGYIFYCPCHGRFGNQADQFLGSLAFAKQLNRTLILPPWRTYSGTQKMVPFDDFFQVEPIRSYHRVILAKDFVTHLAPTHWPLDQRSAFCYKIDDEKPCTTDSEFFEEFWQFVGVPLFAGSESIKGLRFDAEGAEEWKKRFPPNRFSVISLRGPPAPFPVPLSQWPLQKYLKWSTKISSEATKHISSLFGDEAFLGIHLRNGEDWKKACNLLEENRLGLKNLMSSSQCIGENPENAVTREMCFPTEEEIFLKISEIFKKNSEILEKNSEILEKNSEKWEIFSTKKKLKKVFVATDTIFSLENFKKKFPDVDFFHLNPDVPQIDLYILGEAEIFIGNCVSSFSSFVRRQRDVTGKKTFYFGLENPISTAHEEL